ncbi:fasciclin domain-containing protein [Pseudoroseomonas ludipueritiae]|uniref:Fasciclin domain-containing protein n=1 Tax=Pseudoroseomonas ludipueritiae TaxID=198093 RepID=A0ABR7R5Z1_9PROT|nr:fasciclin domain-containing protein [Pseudoroseomonas ludipueritiae]MBC9177088.1 fasciclin domain-containing protein [Pseudoroseomonas ludipueritiae]MCG7362134.1 fasciclin domain-containing protein [Roseomonas sp. ACRSG]
MTIQRRTLLGATLGATLAAPAVLRAQVASMSDIANTLASVPQFSRFLELAQRGGELVRLRGTQDLTLFVPVNEAIDRHPALMQDLLGTESGNQAGAADQFRLGALLTHHMVAGTVTSQSLAGTVRDMPSINGGLVRLDGRSTPATVAVVKASGGAGSNFGTGAGGQNLQPPARFIMPDLMASNGVVHGIDNLLLP